MGMVKKELYGSLSTRNFENLCCTFAISDGCKKQISQWVLHWQSLWYKPSWASFEYWYRADYKQQDSQCWKCIRDWWDEVFQRKFSRWNLWHIAEKSCQMTNHINMSDKKVFDTEIHIQWQRMNFVLPPYPSAMINNNWEMWL